MYSFTNLVLLEDKTFGSILHTAGKITVDFPE